jgi:pyruvate dehydrogenase E1 component beta subunit
MAKMTMVQAINFALHQEMEKDDRVMVLGEDVGIDGGVFRVTDGLIDKFGDQRVIDTPLAESGIVGMSIGMAVYGLRPVCEIQFSGFSYQNFHQIENHAARVCGGDPRGVFTCRWFSGPHTVVACGPWNTTLKVARHTMPILRA